MSVRIISDSACDIEIDDAKALNLQLIPLRTYFEDEEFLDGVTMSHDQFFEKLIETEKMPTTSQIAPYEFEKIFDEVKESGDTAVVICLSSKLSGSFQNAYFVSQDYEDVIYPVDSLNACVGQQILVKYALELRDKGMSAKDIKEELDQKKKDIRLIALLDTLEYLKKGGRISAQAAFAGTLLSIKPVISVENGEVVVLGKARGSKNGNNMMTQLVTKKGGIDFSMPHTLAYSGLSDALLQKYIKDNQDLFIEEVDPDHLPISTIGCAIGTHIGPGAIGACFFAKDTSAQ